MIVQQVEPEVSEHAIMRMGQALSQAFDLANTSPDTTLLVGFGAAYPALDAMVRQACAKRAVQVVSGEDMLADENLIATHFVGSPDRLFALLRAGYGNVLTHALVGGGAVFPIVHALAQQHGVHVCDIMSDDAYGPYALRDDCEAPYRLLENTNVRVLQPGGDSDVAHGMIGEVVLSYSDDDEADDEPPICTGVLSAFEQVPHRHRKPGLMGWMGFAQPAVHVCQANVRAIDVATLIQEHDEVLDARLIAPVKDEAAAILQVETEAGDWIEENVLESFEALTGLRPQLQRIAPGQFGNTGRVFGLKAA